MLRRPQRDDEHNSDGIVPVGTFVILPSLFEPMPEAGAGKPLPSAQAHSSPFGRSGMASGLEVKTNPKPTYGALMLDCPWKDARSTGLRQRPARLTAAAPDAPEPLANGTSVASAAALPMPKKDPPTISRPALAMRNVTEAPVSTDQTSVRFMASPQLVLPDVARLRPEPAPTVAVAQVGPISLAVVPRTSVTAISVAGSPDAVEASKAKAIHLPPRRRPNGMKLHRHSKVPSFQPRYC